MDYLDLSGSYSRMLVNSDLLPVNSDLLPMNSDLSPVNSDLAVCLSISIILGSLPIFLFPNSLIAKGIGPYTAILFV